MQGEIVIVPWSMMLPELFGHQRWPPAALGSLDPRPPLKFRQPNEKVRLAAQQIICTRNKAPAPRRRHQEGVVKHDFAASPPQFGGVLACRQVDDFHTAFDSPFEAFAHKRSHDAMLAPRQVIA